MNTLQPGCTERDKADQGEDVAMVLDGWDEQELHPRSFDTALEESVKYPCWPVIRFRELILHIDPNAFLFDSGSPVNALLSRRSENERQNPSLVCRTVTEYCSYVPIHFGGRRHCVSMRTASHVPLVYCQSPK